MRPRERIEPQKKMVFDHQHALDGDYYFWNGEFFMVEQMKVASPNTQILFPIMCA